MPLTPITYTTLEALLARIEAHMTENHAQENTGDRTQQLLKEIALSLPAILAAVPAEVGAQFPDWDAGTTYEGNQQLLVDHNGFLYVFVGVDDSTDVEPGTDGTVWQEMSALLLAHIQGTDQMLDAGGPNEVTAEEIREHLDGDFDTPTLAQVLAAGQRTGANDIGVDAGQAIVFRDTESDGQLRLYHDPITDDNVLRLPDKSGLLATTDDILPAQGLPEVMAVSPTTGGIDMFFESGAFIEMLNPDNTLSIDLMAPPETFPPGTGFTVTLPRRSGTLAVLGDVTEAIDGVAALIDGSLKAPEAFTPTGTYPTTYNAAPIQRGDTYRLAAGTMGTRDVNAEDLAIALTDTPGQNEGAWQVIESNRVVATQAEAEDSASTDLAKLITPQRWWQAWTQGLTLSAFFDAVRGTLSTGLETSTTAMSASVSLLVNMGRAMGLIAANTTLANTKLAKASNLSDLADSATARTNLGLKAYATEDFAEALVARGMAAADTHPVPVVGDLVVFDENDSKYHCATPSNAIDRKVGIVTEAVADTVRVQMSGIMLFPVGVISAGDPIYMDPEVPGGITTVRPRSHALYVGRGIEEDVLDFRPSLPVSSGSVEIESDDSAVSDATGTVTALATLPVVPDSVYQVDVYARVDVSAGASSRVLWLAIDSSTATGRVTYGTVITDVVSLDHLSQDLLSIGVVPPSEEGICVTHISALIKIGGHSSGIVGVVLAPETDGEDVTLLAGSTITWQRIG